MLTVHVPVRRGATLINAMLFDENAILPTKVDKSGRDPEKIEKRDDMLLHRLYFKSKIERKGYDDVLNELETEFFLSRTMIQKIITCKSDIALMIKKQGLTTQDLNAKFPWFKW